MRKRAERVESFTVQVVKDYESGIRNFNKEKKKRKLL